MPGQDPTSPVVDPSLTDDPDARAHADYVRDQLQQSQTLEVHARSLRQRAPQRIAAASKARSDAAQPPEPGTLDDYHVVRHLLDERAFYPPHDKRAESPAYAKVHKEIAVTEDHRCLVCGVRTSTLHDDAQNPFGAVQIETHHRTVEWALANAVDADKFNQHIVPGLRREAQARKTGGMTADAIAVRTEFDGDYALGADGHGTMTLDRIHQWVDHAFDNLWPLCDVHHRHKYVGIHAITYPIWGPQDVVDARSIANQIGLAHQKGDAPAPA